MSYEPSFTAETAISDEVFGGYRYATNSQMLEVRAAKDVLARAAVALRDAVDALQESEG